MININYVSATKYQDKIISSNQAIWNSLVNVKRTEEVEIVQITVCKEFCCEREERNKAVASMGDESKKDFF